MKKILITNTIGMQYEGISSVIINYLSHMDLNDLSVAVLVNDETPDSMKKILLGFGKICIIPNRKQEFGQYLWRFYTTLKDFRPDVVHIHGNSGTMFLESFLCKICGVTRIVVHCHNTTCSHPIVNIIFRIPMIALATNLLACSPESGKWLYGSHSYMVLNNAIDFSKYFFSKQIRKDYREKMGIEKQKVIGHVGHFTDQKNHDFLIEIFVKVLQYKPDTILLLVGEGPKLDIIKEKVFNLGIADHVVFTGVRDDVERLYQVMDLFVLPSKWEGLPLVTIEAQAAGLPLLVSDAVTRRAECTSLILFKNIQDGAESWAHKLVDILNVDYIRQKPLDTEIRQSGFDIRSEAQKLKKIYMGS